MTAVLVAPATSPVRRIRTAVVHPMQVNFLQQVRDVADPEGIAELANNIVALGLLQFPSAGEFTRRELPAFLRQHNALWGTNYRASDLTPNFETGLYLVACFGHRRTLAHQYLWLHGCDTCVERYGVEAAGTCWARHGDVLDPAGMEIRVVRGLDWMSAMLRQLAENTYVPVSRDREAIVWRALWEKQRSTSPKLTIKAFAHQVGRSAAIVSEALRFCDLPAEVRVAVAKKHIAWGIATELLRLQAAGCSESEIIYRKNYAIVRRPTVEKFHQVISGVIREREMSQEGMFELAVEEIRTVELSGRLERSAIRTLELEERELLAKLAAMRDGQLTGEFAAAMQTRQVQAALARADQLHAGLHEVQPSTVARRTRRAS